MSTNTGLPRSIALLLVSALSLSQVVGWATTYSSPAILGPAIAGDLAISVTQAMAGSSFFLIAMAFASPFMGRLYKTVGAARLMTFGSLLLALALAGVAGADTVELYWLCWLVIGASGAAVLTTSAHTLLVEVLGRGAKSWIAAVMLISGLAASVGYPVTAAAMEFLGWRGTFYLFALMHVLLCCPLHGLCWWLSVRMRRSSSVRDAQPVSGESAARGGKGVFSILAAAVSLIGFVTWGFAIVIVELFKEAGLPQVEAVALASAIGIFQVAARALEFTFARQRSSVRTAVDASALMVGAFLVIIFGQGWIAAALFVLFYGLASGVMSVARSTMPLELFDPADYGAMMARLSLPMNLGFAAAPVAFGWLLERLGAPAVLYCAAGLAAAAFLCLFTLRRMTRPAPIEAA